VPMLAVWGLIYSLAAVFFNLTSDAVMLISAGVVLGAWSDLTPRPPLHIGEGEQSRERFSRSRGEIRRVFQSLAVAFFAGFIGLALTSSETRSLDVAELDGSIGHVGSNQEAFLLGGTVVHLEGARDPHLRELVDGGDVGGVIVATAPDYLLIESLPDDPSVRLLDYRSVGGVFQRGVDILDWLESESTRTDFGPDLRLTAVQQDRTQTDAGGIVRLRLDWQWLTNKRPDSRLLFNLQIVGDGVIGSVEQTFPPEKWDAARGTITTYHVLPINADAPPGLYDIRLSIDINAGVLDRRTVAQIKAPAPTDTGDTFDEEPLAIFDDGVQSAALMGAEVRQQEGQILLDLTWRAERDFEDDFTIFVHLTRPDDPTPLVQADAPPDYPTFIWAAGEVIETSYVLPLDDLSPGDTVIRVGFVHPERGRMGIDAGGDAYVVEFAER